MSVSYSSPNSLISVAVANKMAIMTRQPQGTSLLARTSWLGRMELESKTSKTSFWKFLWKNKLSFLRLQKSDLLPNILAGDCPRRNNVCIFRREVGRGQLTKSFTFQLFFSLSAAWRAEAEAGRHNSQKLPRSIFSLVSHLQVELWERISSLVWEDLSLSLFFVFVCFSAAGVHARDVGLSVDYSSASALFSNSSSPCCSSSQQKTLFVRFKMSELSCFLMWRQEEWKKLISVRGEKLKIETGH